MNINFLKHRFRDSVLVRKYMTFTGIIKNSEQHFFTSKRCKRLQWVGENKLLQTFQTLQTKVFSIIYKYIPIQSVEHVSFFC